MQKRALMVQVALRKELRSFKKFPAVDAWLRKYASGRLCDRKKVLVLTGPSGVGKTAFVRNLFGAGSVLELNAAGLSCVNLQAFDPEQHRCILWDEAGPRLIADNRKVFQHPACWVDIGHSPTGQHIQHVWLNDSVSCVCTNRWHEDVEAIPSELDRQWLQSNVVVVRVEEPMWLP